MMPDFREQLDSDIKQREMYNIDVRNKSRSKSITSYRLKKIVDRMMKNLFQMHGMDNPEISILFTDDEHMRSLNLQYRNIDSTTDVLAFPMQDGRFPNVGPNILGDIVISIPTAKKQAEEHEHSLEKEIATLLIHGFLHLTGYDDVSDSAKAKMKRREKEIMLQFKQRGVL